MIRTTSGLIARMINTLVEDISKLSQEIDGIQRFSNITKEHNEQDISLLPRGDILGALWDHLKTEETYN